MNWTYRQEYVKCGKKGCKSCPHGPYWYRYRQKARRMYKQYVGKERDPGQGRGSEYLLDAQAERWDRIFSASTASLALAKEILTIEGLSFAEAKKRYRELSLKYHPDRNSGDDKMFKWIGAAWTYFTSCQ